MALPGRTQPAGWRQSFRAFRHTNFRWYWVSGLGMSADLGIRQLAVAWLVLDLTGSVGQLGLVVFMQGLPMSVVSLFGGILADRYDRRVLLVSTQLFTMTVLSTLAALTIADQVLLWHIYVSSIVLGIAQALGSPARQAFIATLVDKEDLMNAVALTSMLQHSTRIIWPSLAGGLIILAGVGPTLAVNAACLIAGIGGLLMMRRLREAPRSRRASPLVDIADGVRYVWATPTVAMVLLVTQMLGLFGLVLLHMGPGFAREEMGLNAAETGVFVMFMGVGAVIGSSVLTSLDIRHKAGWYVAHCLLMAVSLFLLAANPWYFSAFAIMGLYGYANSVQVILSNTIFQLVVPTNLLGRVVSLWFLAGGLASVAALPIGILGEVFDLRIALGGSAILMLFSILWFGVIRPPGRGKQTMAQETAPGTEVGPPSSAGPESRASP